MIGWLDSLQQLTEAKQACVLVTVAGTRGSTPRETGAKMIVTATEIVGTIGGGQLEHQCVRAACDWLRHGAGGRSRLQRIPLGTNCGQCCGGVAEVLFEEITGAQAAWVSKLTKLYATDTPATLVTARQSRTEAGKLIVTAEDHFTYGGIQPTDTLLATARDAIERRLGAFHTVSKLAGNAELPILIEPVRATDFHIVVFGAGHVGAACVNTLSMLDARIDLVDSRPGVLNDAYPANVQALEAADPTLLAAASPARYYLVMTHDHALDLDICVRLLQRTDIAYCGLIGSISKRRRFDQRRVVIGSKIVDVGTRHFRQRQVRVRVDETRQDDGSAQINDARIVRDRYVRADGGDLPVFDQDDLIRQGYTLFDVDELPRSYGSRLGAEGRAG